MATIPIVSPPDSDQDMSMVTDPFLLDTMGTGLPVTMDTIMVQHTGLDQRSFDEKYGRIPDDRPTAKEVFGKLRQACRCSGSCLSAFIRQHVPLVDLITTYKFKEYILGDIIAGISLAILQVPQGMGYALLATLPPIIGLYTSFFPVLVYFIFGRSRHVSIGTMALTSLILASSMSKVIPQFIEENSLNVNHNATNVTGNGSDVTMDLDNLVAQEKVKIAMSISLMAGIFLVAMGMMRLGILAAYISDPFMSGYISGCNIQVLTHQLHHLLGITVGHHTGPLSFFSLLWDICLNLKNTNIATLITSIIAIAVLFLVKKFVNERYAKHLKVPVPIDIIVVIVATMISHFCMFEERFDVRIVQKIPQGLPEPTVPSPRYMGMFVLDAFILGLVNYILMFIMVKMFSQKYSYPYDTNQEMFATGLAAVFGSFFSSMAGSTSPPRCILGDSAGAQTQLAQFFSASLMLLILLFLAPLLESLPLCILASLILISCIPLFVYYKACVVYWRTSKHDLAVWTVSFAATMIVGVDIGIIVGIGFSMLVVVVRTQRPYTTTLQLSLADNAIVDSRKYSQKASPSDSIRIFKFEAPLYFATIDIFKAKVFAMVGQDVARKDVICTAETRVKSAKTQAKSAETQAKSAETQAKSAEAAANCNEDLHLSENSQMMQQQECDDDKCGSNVEAIILDCSSMVFIDTSGAKSLAELHTKYDAVGVPFVLANVSETARRTLGRLTECQGVTIYPSTYDAIIGVKNSRESRRLQNEHSNVDQSLV